MTGQLSFAEVEAPPPLKDRLFFALLPDAAASSAIERVAADLRAAHRLGAKPIGASRLHVTLFHVGDFPAMPHTVIEAASRAAASLTAAPVRVRFDHAGTFVGKGRFPFVLRAAEGADALTAFQQRLTTALAKAGTGRPTARPFTPHVTLMYADREVAACPIDAIEWTAKEFVLVHSLIGESRHSTLGRWPLTA
jgi:RNA 2',3'-cyclic 3'-phosphodiesterase